MKNYFDENDIIYRKALLFIPDTEENIKYCEESNILNLITQEAIQVEVELCDEDELIPAELYDIYIDGKHWSSEIPGKWLTLI